MVDKYIAGALEEFTPGEADQIYSFAVVLLSDHEKAMTALTAERDEWRTKYSALGQQIRDLDHLTCNAHIAALTLKLAGAEAALRHVRASATTRDIGVAISYAAYAAVTDFLAPPPSSEADVREICEGCGAEIDPDCCGCGDSREGHDTMWVGHSFVPMGCNCMRAPSSEAGT